LMPYSSIICRNLLFSFPAMIKTPIVIFILPDNGGLHNYFCTTAHGASCTADDLTPCSAGAIATFPVALLGDLGDPSCA